METIVKRRIEHFLDERGVRFSQLNSNGRIYCSTLTSLLSAFTDLSAEWLLRGEGQMIREIQTGAVIGDYNIVGNSNIGEINVYLSLPGRGGKTIRKTFNELLRESLKEQEIIY